jgi:hypothetical protein
MTKDYQEVIATIIADCKIAGTSANETTRQVLEVMTTHDNARELEALKDASTRIRAIMAKEELDGEPPLKGGYINAGILRAASVVDDMIKGKLK